MTTRSYLLAGTLLLLLSSCYNKTPVKDPLISIQGTYSMQSILRKIEDQTGKRFFYSNNAFDDQQQITVDWDKLALSDVLTGLLKDQKLHWNEKERIVVLCPDTILFR